MYAVHPSCRNAWNVCSYGAFEVRYWLLRIDFCSQWFPICLDFLLLFVLVSTFIAVLLMYTAQHGSRRCRSTVLTYLRLPFALPVSLRDHDVDLLGML